MFRHQGKSRTIKHNLQIATVLSFVAGIVNVTGFLEFKQLTTNVTGHFALFIYDVANFKVWNGTIYLLYIFSFLFGSFLSSFLIEKYKQNKKLNVFALPTIIEFLTLISIPIFYNLYQIEYPDIIVCTLLFAMGLQNSFVTKISDAIVRTTHLTGLFTDLGIELSQLFFPKSYPNKKKIKETIMLRVFIISFFFFGGLFGGFLYSKVELRLNTLIIPAIILIISLLFDDFRFSLLRAKRKLKSKKSGTGTKAFE